MRPSARPVSTIDSSYLICPHHFSTMVYKLNRTDNIFDIKVLFQLHFFLHKSQEIGVFLT